MAFYGFLWLFLRPSNPILVYRPSSRPLQAFQRVCHSLPSTPHPHRKSVLPWRDPSFLSLHHEPLLHVSASCRTFCYPHSFSLFFNPTMMAPSFVQAAVSLCLVSSVWASLDSRYDVVYDLALNKRAVSSNLPESWSYQGCYSEAANGRTLSGASYSDNTAMTVETCIAYCDTQSYIYSGVEYSEECYCGNSIAAGTVAAVGDCNMAVSSLHIYSGLIN
jgi:hypothetical protein